MRLLKNGQWTLESLVKADDPDRTPDEGNWPSIHHLIGKPQTVEVHPDMDHLYNVKGLVQESGRPYLHVGDIKKTGRFGNIINKLPRDARGRVTPEMIDQRIAKLPKQKVQISVAPFTSGHQQHRGNRMQYVASVGLHPDTLASMSQNQKDAWAGLSNFQHHFGVDGHPQQMGWARIDPWKQDHEGGISPNDDHWHLDEIQSDYGTPEKLKGKLQAAYYNPLSIDERHFSPEYQEKLRPISRDLDAMYTELMSKDKMHFSPEHKAEYDALKQKWENASEKYNEIVKNAKQDVMARRKASNPEAELKTLLSHGHEDPQHLVHSAVNQFARQNGIKSTSLDLPSDQAEQSGLRPKKGTGSLPYNPYHEWYDRLGDIRAGDNPLNGEERDRLWNSHGKDLAERHKADIHFKSAVDKLGEKGLREWADLPTQDNSSWMLNGSDDDWDEQLKGYEHDGKHYGDMYDSHFSPKTKNVLVGLSNEEKNALSRYLMEYEGPVNHYFAEKHGLGPAPENRDIVSDKPPEYDIPVHQINTYDKRPRKLGMKVVPKAEVMGESPEDIYRQVQYGKLYKRLQELQDLLKNG